MEKYGWGSVQAMSSSDLQFYVNRANGTTWNSSDKCVDVVDAITELPSGSAIDVFMYGTHSADNG